MCSLLESITNGDTISQIFKHTGSWFLSFQSCKTVHFLNRQSSLTPRADLDSEV